MPDNRQTFGRQSEIRAARYLEKQGYVILKQNYRNKFGEIDIIAKDENVLVFVEVKARRSTRFGSPKYAVDRRKQVKISRASLSYLKETCQLNVSARFDVVSICSGAEGHRMELVKNAFPLAC